MEPLSPNDPLWNLLGKTKPVELRPNFVQNVVRAARQTPQERGMIAWLKGWWQDQESAPALVAWSAVAAVALLSLTVTFTPEASTPQVAMPSAVKPATEEVLVTEADFLVPEFETQWENLTQMGDLVAVQDTSELTDREIRMLLY